MTEHNEGITFSEVCHFPAIPSTRHDYRNITEDVDDKLREDQAAAHLEWRTNMLADRHIGDIIPDSELVLDDNLHDRQLHSITLKHAISTHDRNQTPRTLPEACGIVVRIESGKRITAAHRAKVAGVDIPDPDFTVDALASLRRLEPFKDDPYSVVSFARRLETLWLNLDLPQEYAGTPLRKIPSEILTEHLLERLSPEKLPDYRLMGLMVEYGRMATATAVVNQSAVPRYLQQLIKHCSGNAENASLTRELMKKRLALCRVETVDYLQERADPDNAVVGMDEEAAGQYGQSVISLGILKDWTPPSHIAYHEGYHAAGGNTIKVTEDDEGKPKLKLLGHQTNVIVQDVSVGLKSVEAVTEVAAREAYGTNHTKPGSSVYDTEVDRYYALDEARPEEMRFARNAGFLGMSSQAEVDRMVEFNQLFDTI